MSRYIDADKLTNKIFPMGLVNDGRYTINAKAVKYAIDQTPTADVVEVVRCKGCKSLSLSGGSYWCKETGFEMKSYELDHFCSYGEKKHETTL